MEPMDTKRRVGRPRLTDEQRRTSQARQIGLRRCASLARSRTLTVFRERYPEEYREIYRAEYRALKRSRLDGI
jgi:hypothetical protein